MNPDQASPGGAPRAWRCAAVCFFFMLSLGAAVHAGPNALVLWDDEANVVSSEPPALDDPGLNPNTRALISAMRDAGINVILSDRPQFLYTGFNPAPTVADVVVHLNGGSALAVMLTAGVTRLVDYVQNRGGGYIGGEANATQLGIPFGQGVNAALGQLMLQARTGGVGAQQPLTITILPAQAAHPVFNAAAPVDTSFSFSAARLVGTVKSFPEFPALALAADDRNSDAVAIREFGTGRVLSFHHAGNQGGADALSNPNVQRLYINGVFWADRTPPRAVEIVPDAAGTITDTDTASFTARFSEGVLGVNAQDFIVAGGLGLAFNETVAVAAVSDREYTLTVSGLNGRGALGVNLLDDDSITDMSVSRNPLGGTGPQNGNAVGATVEVDLVPPDDTPPQVTSLSIDPGLPGVGETPVLTVLFDELMDTAVNPVVSVTTAANASISTTPDPGWTTGVAYKVRFNRPVQAPDAGPAAVSIASARDLAGNVMQTDASRSVTLISAASVFADLRITKTNGTAVSVPGANTVYTITVTNAGPGNVIGARVTDALRSVFTGATWTCNGTGGASCTAAGTGSIDDAANLPSGASVVYIMTAAIDSAATGAIENAAAVALPEGGQDPNPGDNAAEDRDDLAPEADLGVSLIGVTTPVTGRSFAFAITVTNFGPSDVRDAPFRAAFPASMTGAAWNCAESGGADCTGQGLGSIQDTIDLPAGASATYSVSANIAAGASGPLELSASIDAPAAVPDPNNANNAASDPREIAAAAALAITFPSAPVTRDTQFTSAINAAVGATALGAYDITLTYDPAVVTIDRVEGGATTQFSAAPAADPATFASGSTRIQASQSASANQPTGAVNIARVTFNAIGAPNAVSALTFSQTALRSPANQPFAVDITPGSVTISSVVLTPPSLTVAPTSREVALDGGGVFFAVGNSGQMPLTYTAQIVSGDFITITGGANGQNQGNVTLACAPNTGAATRTARIRVEAPGAQNSPREVTITQPGCPILSPPQGVQATDGTRADQILVTWNAVPDAVRYGVFRARENSVDAATRIGTATATSFEDRSADPPIVTTTGGGCSGEQTTVTNVPFFYFVRAESDCRQSDFGPGDAGFVGVAQAAAASVLSGNLLAGAAALAGLLAARRRITRR